MRPRLPSLARSARALLVLGLPLFVACGPAVDPAAKADLDRRLAEIATNEETGLSLMPAAFAQSIPENDLQNLLAWLIGHRTAR